MGETWNAQVSPKNQVVERTPRWSDAVLHPGASVVPADELFCFRAQQPSSQASRLLLKEHFIGTQICTLIHMSSGCFHTVVVSHINYKTEGGIKKPYVALQTRFANPVTDLPLDTPFL